VSTAAATPTERLDHLPNEVIGDIGRSRSASRRQRGATGRAVLGHGHGWVWRRAVTDQKCRSLTGRKGVGVR
jgi:hypothetical protein